MKDNKLRKILVIFHKTIIKVILLLLYLGSFGLFLVFVYIFKNEKYFQKGADRETFWEDAEGYDEGLEEALFQS